MEKMVYSWLMVLVMVCHYSLPSSSAITSQRNLLQFNNMISYKGYSSFDYNGYGCWCGYGSHGSLSVDGTDMCCKIHDECYDRFTGGFFGCSPKIVYYAWEHGPNKTIECTDKIGTCDRNICECDKEAADCFEKHRPSYNGELRDLGNNAKMSLICNP